MTDDLKNIWAIFAPAERRKSIEMPVLVILVAVAETLGLLAIMPFLSVLGAVAMGIGNVDPSADSAGGVGQLARHHVAAPTMRMENRII